MVSLLSWYSDRKRMQAEQVNGFARPWSRLAQLCASISLSAMSGGFGSSGPIDSFYQGVPNK
jgi:hypothetical protein